MNYPSVLVAEARCNKIENFIDCTPLYIPIVISLLNFLFYGTLLCISFSSALIYFSRT